MNFLKKLWADEAKRNGIMFVIMTFVFTFTLFLGGTSRGFISTFPIFFVSAVIVFLFYRNIKNALLMTTLLSLTMSLADSTGYNSVAQNNPTMNLAVAKVIFFILTSAAAFAIAGWLRTKAKSGYVKGILLTVLYLVCFNLVFGNIFGAVKAQSNTEKYLADTYPLQTIESMSTAFNFKTHYYETTITFKEPQRKYYGEEKMVLDNNYDGYFLYAKQAIFEVGRSTMTAAVRESNAEIQFSIKNLPFDDKVNKMENSMFDLGGDYSKVFPSLSYEVEIKNDTASLEEFYDYCEIFTTALEGKFQYRHLEFYGGEKGGYLYQGEVRDGKLTVQPFDEASYTDRRKTGALN